MFAHLFKNYSDMKFYAIDCTAIMADKCKCFEGASMAIEAYMAKNGSFREIASDTGEVHCSDRPQAGGSKIFKKLCPYHMLRYM